MQDVWLLSAQLSRSCPFESSFELSADVYEQQVSALFARMYPQITRVKAPLAWSTTLVVRSNSSWPIYSLWTNFDEKNFVENLP